MWRGAGTGEVDVARGRDESGATYDRSSGRQSAPSGPLPPSPFKEAHFAPTRGAGRSRASSDGCPEGGTVLGPVRRGGHVALVANAAAERIMCELNPDTPASRPCALRPTRGCSPRSRTSEARIGHAILWMVRSERIIFDPARRFISVKSPGRWSKAVEIARFPTRCIGGGDGGMSPKRR